jgi:hypothetical protein
MSVLLVTLAAACVGYAIVPNVATASGSANADHGRARPALAEDLGVTPKAPAALAAGPHGSIYVVDISRDEILERLANGRFVVVAGDGKRGFSGDGGYATRAELRLNRTSGIAIARNGAVYFSDSGNDRIRVILPSGHIETVAGGGSGSLPAQSGVEVAAKSVSLGSPAGLAIANNGDMYVAGAFVERLTPAGDLSWVAGSSGSSASACRSTGCALPEAAFRDADALAFDGRGNLYISSGDFTSAGYGVAEIRAHGSPVYIGPARGEGGAPPALAAANNGTVLIAAQDDIVRIQDGGGRTQVALSANRKESLVALLSAALGSGRQGSFFGGDGIAVGPSGAIYASTSPLATTTPYAIVEAPSSGPAKVVWKS